MLHLIDVVLIIAAVVCLGIAAFGHEPFARLKIGWLGLMFWAIVVAISIIT